MINKLYDILKRYFKENYKLIIFLCLSYIVLTFPLPYYIYKPGDIIDIDDKVEVSNSYDSKGTFNFVYVTEMKGTIPTVFLSYILKDWELIKEENVVLDNETYEDTEYRNKMFLETTNKCAAKIAYTKANKDFTVKNKHNYVVYISNIAKTDITTTDEIISLNDVKVESLDEYTKLVEQYNIGDVLNIQTKTKEDKIVDKTIEVIEINNIKTTGIYFLTDFDYSAAPNIIYKFEENESGPSGGLMLTLTIYNKLVEEDITKGHKISGTGTIDLNGNIGKIGGIEHKTISANKRGTEIFLVPAGDNYESAIKVKEERKLKMQIIGIETFEDALNYLRGL